MTRPDVLSKLWTRCMQRVRSAYWVEFDLDSADGFLGVDYLMVLGGVHLSSTNPTVRRWWNIYRWLVVMTLPLLAWKLGLNMAAGKKLDVILQNVQVVLGATVAIVRMVLTTRNYDSVMVVRRYVNERFFGRMELTSLRTRAAGFYNVRWAVVTFAMFQFCAVFPLAFMDLTQNDSFGLPFDLREFSAFFHTVMEKFFCVMLTWLSVKCVLNNLTVYMIMKGLLTELTVVSKTFEGIMDRAEKRTSAMFDSTAGSSRHLRVTRQRFFWKYLHEEFRNCIQLHQEFLNTLATAKPLLNATFLILYYSTTLNIAFGTVYLLSTDPSQITIYSGQVFYYVGTLMLECWILTHLVTSLTEMNNAISDAVYGLDWPYQLEYDPENAVHYRSIRNTMSTVMARAGRELRFNCFGFFEFTLEQFTELVHLAYSLVTFFRNFV